VRFELDNGMLKINGHSDFTIRVDNPKLSLSELYKAIFADLEKDTFVIVSCTNQVRSDKSAFSIYQSVKTIIDNTLTTLNDE
jgi:hypothetical protein